MWVVARLMLVVGAVICFALPWNRQAVLWRTLGLGLGASFVAIPLAILAAVSANRPTFVGKTLLLTLIGLAVVPPYVNVSCWDSAFGKLGWLTSAQGQILQPLLTGWAAAIWVHALGFVPQFALLFLISLFTGRTFEEQARLDISSIVVFFHITLRRLLPLMLMCIFWALILCSREIAVTDLFQIGTLAEQIYLGYALGQVNALPANQSAESIASAGTTEGWVRIAQFLFIVALSIGFFSRAAGFSKDGWSTMAVGGDPERPAGTWLNGVGVLFLLLLLVAVPLVNLIFQAGTSVLLVDGQPHQIWTVENVFGSIGKTALEFRSAFCWSGVIAVSASSLIVVCATIVCFLAKINRVAWWGMITLTALAAGLSGPDIGSGLTELLSKSENRVLIWLYDCTIVPAVIANVIFCWPLVTLIVWFAISQTTRDQIESASFERLGIIHRIYEFGFRQHWQMFVGVWMLATTICFSELSASQMVLPPGVETVPQVTLGKLHAGVNETTAALSMLTIGLVVAIALSAWIIVQRSILRQRRR